MLYQQISLLIHKDFFTPFDTLFLFISTLLESLKIVIINMVTVLMMSAKMSLFLKGGLGSSSIVWDRYYVGT